MNTSSLRARLWALLLAASSLGACSINTYFDPVGGTPEWKSQLDVPDPVLAEPGTLGVRMFSPTLKEAGLEEQVAEGIRAAAAQSGIGPMPPVTDPTKKPQYEIVLCEAGRDGSFSGNAAVGVATAAVSALVVGGTTGNLRKAMIAGGIVGAASYLGFGNKNDVHLFRVTCFQYTSSAGGTRLTSDSTVKTLDAAGFVNADTKAATGQAEIQAAVDSTYFDVKGNRLEWVKFFFITADGGAFTTEPERTKAAADKVVRHFGSYVFGGRKVY